MLKVRNLRVGYGGREVIKGISFELRGCVAALIGPNGSGKTTLLKAIAGILRYEGEVLINGRRVNELSTYERGRYVTYIPPTVSGMPDMSVGDLLLTGRDVSLERLEYYAELLGVKDLLYRRLWEVSSGELERALIARGLARDSLVYLIDEPLSYTDMKYQIIILKHLRRLAGEGRLVIIASNQLNPLLNYVDRILAIKDGRLFLNSTLKDGVKGLSVKLSELYGVKVKVLESDGYLDVVPVE